MGRSGIRQIAQMRLPLFLTIGLVVFIVTMVIIGLVSDLVTASILFTLLALPMTVLVFWAARYLHLRIRRVRMNALREEDRRNRDYMAATIILCRSLVIGERRSSSSNTDIGGSTMRHVAYHMGVAKTQYGHLLSDTGGRIVDKVRDLALAAVSGMSCASADLFGVIDDLRRLEDEILDLDDPDLERRRMVAAGAEDPAPE